MGTHPIFESDFDCLTEAIMSDTEAPAAAPAPVAAQGYSVETAVQETLKHAQHRDGLARGLNEAFCVEHQIPILKIGDNKTLGEWSGLCKIDREGNAVKVVGCSCVVVREVDDNAAWDYLQNHLKKH